MSTEVQNVVAALKKLKGQYENAPKGIPEPATNADTTDGSGSYAQEDLTDPGIQNKVTGSGGGPIIGRRGRSYKGSC